MAVSRMAWPVEPPSFLPSAASFTSTAETRITIREDASRVYWTLAYSSRSSRDFIARWELILQLSLRGVERLLGVISAARIEQWNFS